MAYIPMRSLVHGLYWKLFVGYKDLLTKQTPKVESLLVWLCYIVFMYNIDCVAWYVAFVAPTVSMEAADLDNDL